MVIPLVIIGKLISFISQIFKIGSGETWPGEIALKVNQNILAHFTSKLEKGVILIAGTNGKTTTSLMIKKVLEKKGFLVIHNGSGANLVNGLVSSFIKQSSWLGRIKADYAVFEVDENTLPGAIFNFQFSIFNEGKKLIIVLLNLFRDQLDRYGEVDVIAEKWEKALNKLTDKTTLILNSDDPLIAYLGKSVKAETKYFGLSEGESFQRSLEHATDSIFCLNCGDRLNYKGIFFSHLGIWYCGKCGVKRPKPDLSDWEMILPGLYNRYNTLAAVCALKSLGIDEKDIKQGLSGFSPAFGRQEEIEVNGKKIKIFLSKNPTGFNESLKTIISLGAKELLLVLNDRIPDGRDVSWIWDVDFEMLPVFITPVVSGDRAYDMAVRLKYAQKSQISNLKSQNHNSKYKTYENLEDAINYGLSQINSRETLYILPTYSAMLEVRKILKGRKIL